MSLPFSSLKTTFATNVSELSQVLQDFDNTIAYESSVIGFDVSYIKSKYNEKAEIEAFHLCDGKQVLIVHKYDITSDDTYRRLFMDFIGSVGATFVGIGIKRNVEIMERELGVVCKNAVELGEMAARIRNDPVLAYSGLVHLAFATCCDDPQPKKPKKQFYLDTFQVGNGGFYTGQESGFNAYMFWKIGSTLLSN